MYNLKIPRNLWHTSITVAKYVCASLDGTNLHLLLVLVNLSCEKGCLPLQCGADQTYEEKGTMYPTLGPWPICYPIKR